MMGMGRRWLRIDGRDVVSPTLGKLIALVNITLQQMLLKKLHRKADLITIQTSGFVYKNICRHNSKAKCEVYTLQCVSSIHLKSQYSRCELYLEAGPENGWMGKLAAGSCVPPTPTQSVTPQLALASPQKVSGKSGKASRRFSLS